MRIIANVKENPEVKRIMICDTGDDVYLFLYDKIEDCPCYADYWFESVEDAIISCETDYNVGKKDWTEIKKTSKDCQDDWIEPVRVKGRNIGKPEWGKYEKLQNDEWVEL